jgi:hypothetical protein
MREWIVCACVLSLAIGVPAVAQKYPGTTIPAAPAPSPAPSVSRAPAATQPAPPTQPATSSVTPGSDTAAQQLARSLPLDPATRDMRDRLPPNVAAVEHALGLRPPLGPATDLRGEVPTPRQIVDALAPNREP